ncbi:hypothetical protein B0H11DRAFT_1924656 [Mycena galericulata]|nr:hypothetical protein B0H11DRAFT_1924656 [Mycena galericulata]
MPHADSQKNFQSRRADAPRSGAPQKFDRVGNFSVVKWGSEKMEEKEIEYHLKKGPALAEKGQRQRKGPAPADRAAPAKRGPGGSYSPRAQSHCDVTRDESSGHVPGRSIAAEVGQGFWSSIRLIAIRNDLKPLLTLETAYFDSGTSQRWTQWEPVFKEGWDL